MNNHFSSNKKSLKKFVNIQSHSIWKHSLHTWQSQTRKRRLFRRNSALSSFLVPSNRGCPPPCNAFSVSPDASSRVGWWNLPSSFRLKRGNSSSSSMRTVKQIPEGRAPSQSLPPPRLRPAQKLEHLNFWLCRSTLQQGNLFDDATSLMLNK